MDRPSLEPPRQALRPVRVLLGGHAPRPGRVVVTTRSLGERVVRTVVSIAAWPFACVLAFLVPPHGEPFFLAVTGGIYWIYRQWTTRFVVHSLDASCPRCERALRLTRRSRLGASLSVPCYNCHFTPTLDLSGAAD